jgi:hypothetical protein
MTLQSWIVLIFVSSPAFPTLSTGAQCQDYLQVYFLLDIASIDGQYILPLGVPPSYGPTTLDHPVQQPQGPSIVKGTLGWQVCSFPLCHVNAWWFLGFSSIPVALFCHPFNPLHLHPPKYNHSNYSTITHPPPNDMLAILSPHLSSFQHQHHVTPPFHPTIGSCPYYPEEEILCHVSHVLLQLLPICMPLSSSAIVMIW